MSYSTPWQYILNQLTHQRDVRIIKSLVKKFNKNPYVEIPTSKNFTVQNAAGASLITVSASTGDTTISGKSVLSGYVNVPATNGNAGTLTLGAAATTDVANTSITTNSIIVLFPTNAAAANLVAGSSSPYISAVTASTGFTVATADAVAAAGTETFNYIVFN